MQLSSHVKMLVDQREANIDQHMIKDRDTIMQKLRQAIARAQEQLHEEELQYENEVNWRELIERVEKCVTSESKRAEHRNQRVQLLQQHREQLANSTTLLDKLDSKRTELDTIKQKLDTLEQEVEKRTMEVRNLKNKLTMISKGSSEQKQVVMTELENAKKRRDQCKISVKQLRQELMRNSRTNDSLPEYELYAISANEVAIVTSPVSNAEFTIKDYVVERELMSGAQAKVFLCRSTNKDNAHVVVKVYQVYSVTDAEAGIKEVIYFFEGSNDQFIVPLRTIAWTQEHCEDFRLLLFEARQTGIMFLYRNAVLYRW
jgi:myosin heavy subunit